MNATALVAPPVAQKENVQGRHAAWFARLAATTAPTPAQGMIGQPLPDALAARRTALAACTRTRNIMSLAGRARVEMDCRIGIRGSDYFFRPTFRDTQDQNGNCQHGPTRHSHATLLA